MACERLDAPERNAILAGLRLLQLYNDGKIAAPGIDDVLTNGGEDEVLDNEAIDDLCQNVNCEGLSLGEVA